MHRSTYIISSLWILDTQCLNKRCKLIQDLQKEILHIMLKHSYETLHSIIDTPKSFQHGSKNQNSWGDVIKWQTNLSSALSKPWLKHRLGLFYWAELELIPSLTAVNFWRYNSFHSSAFRVKKKKKCLSFIISPTLCKFSDRII